MTRDAGYALNFENTRGWHLPSARLPTAPHRERYTSLAGDLISGLSGLLTPLFDRCVHAP